MQLPTGGRAFGAWWLSNGESAEIATKPIKGHDGQQNTFSGPQSQKYEQLGHTATVTNYLPGAVQIYQQLELYFCGSKDLGVTDW